MTGLGSTTVREKGRGIREAQVAKEVSEKLLEDDVKIVAGTDKLLENGQMRQRKLENATMPKMPKMQGG